MPKEVPFIAIVTHYRIRIAERKAEGARNSATEIA
jgi:hypothetical protein